MCGHVYLCMCVYVHDYMHVCSCVFNYRNSGNFRTENFRREKYFRSMDGLRNYFNYVIFLTPKLFDSIKCALALTFRAFSCHARAWRNLEVFAAFEDPYCEIWEAAVGEVLMCVREPHNALDRYAVSVNKVGTVIGHLPRRL